jgi:hypothetical protein
MSDIVAWLALGVSVLSGLMSALRKDSSRELDLLRREIDMLRESIKRELDSHQMQINERKGDDLRLWDMFDKGGKHDKP